MSGNAFGSDRATLESRTFRFRDLLNKERRFIPLRLDDAKPKGSIIQFSYVDWCDAVVEAEYMRLLQACRTEWLLARNLPTLRKRWTSSSSCPAKATWNSMAMKPSTSSTALSLFSVAGCTSETRELLHVIVTKDCVFFRYITNPQRELCSLSDPVVGLSSLTYLLVQRWPPLPSLQV